MSTSRGLPPLPSPGSGGRNRNLRRTLPRPARNPQSRSSPDLKRIVQQAPVSPPAPRVQKPEKSTEDLKTEKSQVQSPVDSKRDTPTVSRPAAPKDPSPTGVIPRRSKVERKPRKVSPRNPTTEVIPSLRGPLVSSDPLPPVPPSPGLADLVSHRKTKEDTTEKVDKVDIPKQPIVIPQITDSDVDVIKKNDDRSPDNYDSSDKEDNIGNDLDDIKEDTETSGKKEKIDVPTQVVKPVPNVTNSISTDESTDSDQGEGEKKDRKENVKSSAKKNEWGEISVVPTGSPEKQNKKRKFFWMLIITWFFVIISVISMISAWGYGIWVGNEATKRADQAYAEGAADIVADPTFDTVVRMDEEDFYTMISEWEGNNLPEGHSIDGHSLIGWTIPGGTEDEGRADVEICWTDTTMEDHKSSHVYMVSEDAQEREPTWIIDAVNNTDKNCSPNDY